MDTQGLDRGRFGYSEDPLIIEKGSAVEAALWSALEAIDLQPGE